MNHLDDFIKLIHNNILFDNIINEYCNLIQTYVYTNFKYICNYHNINIHNNRLYFDKLLSSIFSYISIHIIYYYQYIIEYGYIMHYLHIGNIILFIILLI